MINQNQTHSKKDLRSFGLILAFGIPFFFGFFIPYLNGANFFLLPMFLGIIFLLITILFPMVLKFVYGPWMKLGAILGYINTRIILTFLFFVMISPIALVFKIIGRDSLYLKWDKDLKSYKNITSREKIDFTKPF